jgi:hypothetical protein
MITPDRMPPPTADSAASVPVAGALFDLDVFLALHRLPAPTR